MSRYDWITKMVDVEIDISEILEDLEPEDLKKYHLHADHFCTQGAWDEDFLRPLYAAIQGLHEQAHGGGRTADACTDEPCSGLSLRDHPGLGRVR